MLEDFWRKVLVVSGTFIGVLQRKIVTVCAKVSSCTKVHEFHCLLPLTHMHYHIVWLEGQSAGFGHTATLCAKAYPAVQVANGVAVQVAQGIQELTQ